MVKRLARYEVGGQRLINWYRWQEKKKHCKLDVYVDADHAGRPTTQKSTTGVMVRLGLSRLSDVCSTQALVALASGESELYSMIRGIIEGLYST